MAHHEIAVISDIHGNAWAMEAVLEDLSKHQIDTILNLGDSLYGPLDPQGTFALLQDPRILSICGNQDRVILENLHAKSGAATMAFVKSQLTPGIIQWLSELPYDVHHLGFLYCCHACPQDDVTYLVETVKQGHVAIKETPEIDLLISGIAEDMILCGHTHVPRIINVGNKTIVNPGSVGLPAYDDDLPWPHKMESFSPHAKYAMLTYEGGPARITTVSLPYDHEQAAKAAEKNGRPDWAQWIRTGRA